MSARNTVISEAKSTFIISDFNTFSKMFLRQLNFGVLSVWKPVYVYCKGKTPLFFNLYFLLLLSERGLSPESCLAIYHARAVAYKLAAYIKIVFKSKRTLKCSKSIASFFISKLANVEDFFNVKYFLNVNMWEQTTTHLNMCSMLIKNSFLIASPFLQYRIWIQLISQHQTSHQRFWFLK